MLGKKKKAIKLEELAAGQAEILKTIEQAIAEANAVEDVGDRLVKLEEVKEKDIGNAMHAAKVARSRAQDRKGGRILFSTWGGSTAVSTAVTGGLVATGVATGGLFTLPVMVGLLGWFPPLMGLAGAEHDRDAFVKNLKDFEGRLAAQKNNVSQVIDETVNTASLESISESPRFGEVFEKYSRIQSRFNAAAAARQALGKNPAAKEKPVPNKYEAPKKPGSYDHLKKI